jgi:glutamate N-acetyltransferase/amino-acid N-acetyltransferase
MAIGKTKAKLNLNKLSLKFGDLTIVHNGKLYEKYIEREASDYMKKDAIELEIDVASGIKSFTAYTMDLTKEYIKINADYRS